MRVVVKELVKLTNALKLDYMHLQGQNIFPGRISLTIGNKKQLILPQTINVIKLL